MLIRQVPLAIDVLGAAIAVASAPLDIQVLRVNLTGDLTPLGTPTASFQGMSFPSIYDHRLLISIM